MPVKAGQHINMSKHRTVTIRRPHTVDKSSSSATTSSTLPYIYNFRSQ